MSSGSQPDQTTYVVVCFACVRYDPAAAEAVVVVAEALVDVVYVS